MLIRPSGHVGGDLIGCLRLDAERIAVYSIDVSGHGVASAMMTARLAGYFSGSVEERLIAWGRGADGKFRLRRPAEVVSAFNRLMLNDIRAEQYFTMVYAEVCLSRGEVTFVQAGHPHPLLLRRNGEIKPVGAGGLPVGLIEEAQYEEHSVHLRPGDRIVLVSDGMTECPGEKGAELGESGLERLVARLAPLNGPDFLEGLVAGLSRHAGGAGFPDDVSGLLLEYRGESGT